MGFARCPHRGYRLAGSWGVNMWGRNGGGPQAREGGATVFGIGLIGSDDKTLSAAVPKIGQNLHELGWQSLHDLI